MAAQIEENYLTGEDLDDLFTLLEGGFLNNDVELIKELFLTGVENYGQDDVYRCEHCKKVCKSQCGLTRHYSVKHTPHISIN